MIERLESIGYASGSTESPILQNVTVFEKRDAYEGLNFYTSGHAPEAILMDMDGNVLHRWRYDFWEIWPDYPTSRNHEGTEYWRRAYLYPNGDVLAVFEGLGIIKLDVHSKLVWANPLRAHHDLEVLPDGSIYVLSREAHVVPRVHGTEPVLEDFVSVLDADGNEIRRVSLLEAVERSRFTNLWRATKGRTRDLYHTNSLTRGLGVSRGDPATTPPCR